MGDVFKALGSEHRRRMLDIIKERPGCCVNDVADCFSESRIAVMRHLRVLEEAGLIITEKCGRERRMYFNSVPIQMIYDRWTTEFSALWASGITRLKYRIENKEADDE